MSNINNLGQSSQLGDVVVPAVPLFSGLSEMTADGMENFASGGVTHSATPSLVFFATWATSTPCTTTAC
jgi:hypothetical protein